MEKQKSDMSTTSYLSRNPNLMSLIEELTEENQYLKKALSTAESLIDHYQEENETYKAEIKILNNKLKQTEKKCEELQQSLNRMEMKINKKVSMAKNESIMKNQKIQQLNRKIKQLMEMQEKYEGKIEEMENKIVLLERTQDYNKITKQQCLLNIGIVHNFANNIFNDVEHEKRPRNISELQALHNRIKNKQVQSDREAQKNKMGIVQRVFSKEAIRCCTPGKATKRNECLSNKNKK